MGKDIVESGAAGIVDIDMNGIGVARGPAIKCEYVPAYWWEASRQRRRGRPSLRLGQILRRHLFSFQLRTTKVRRISATRRPSWFVALVSRSEERRVGKELFSTCRSRGSPEHEKKKKK